MKTEIPAGFVKCDGNENPVPWNKGAVLLTAAGEMEIQSPRTTDEYNTEIEVRWQVADDGDDIVAYKLIDLSDADILIEKFREFLLYAEDWENDPINQHPLMKATFRKRKNEIKSMIETYMRMWPTDPALNLALRVNYWGLEPDE